MISFGRTLWFVLIAAMLWAGVAVWEISPLKYQAPLEGTCNSLTECGFTSVLATLELAGSRTEFTTRINQKYSSGQELGEVPAHNITIVADNTWIDFLYIPLYWTVYLLFSHAFRGRFSAWIICAITIAAVFDVAENLLLLRAMHELQQTTTLQLQQDASQFLVPGPVSHIKWSFLAVASILLGLDLFPRAPFAFKMIALPMIVSGLLTAVGQFYFPLLFAAVSLLFVALLVVVITGFPFRFSRANLTAGALQWLNYIYFVRFSLLLWLLILLLATADSFGSSTAITLGILTPETNGQLVLASFFIVLSGWLALTLARVICAYGEERFGTPAPVALSVDTSMAWSTFLFAQFPGAILLDRIARNANVEGKISPGCVIFFLALGALAAFAFWVIVAILYYWTYQPKPQTVPAAADSRPLLDDPLTARAFLIPNSPWLRLERLENLPNPPVASFVRWLFDKIAARGAGYRRLDAESEAEGIELHSGHAIAFFLFLGFFSLYIGLMPITAPFEVSWPRRIVQISVVAIFILALWNLKEAFRNRSLQQNYPRAKQPGARTGTGPGRRWYGFLTYCATTVLIAFGAFLAWQPKLGEMRVFPVVASIFVLLIFGTCVFSGLAFWADRFRIPVLILALSLITLMNLRLFRVDHQFQSVHLGAPLTGSNAPRTPGQVLHALEPDQTVRPLIIVTATGGGIQAAQWTAEILASLEQSIATRAGFKYPFHDSILLMSTVSGGSVGTVPFMREYGQQHSAFAPGSLSDAHISLDDRFVSSAGCSSLEATAWGLIYPDLARLLAPGLFRYHILPVAYDRGMTLEQGFINSLTDHYCHKDRNLAQNDGKDPRVSTLIPGRHETSNGNSYFVPAFTFNTTVTETGDRFLLGNYQINEERTDDCQPATKGERVHSDTLPAASFLEVYAEPCNMPDGKHLYQHLYSDLDLTTAARLSASFTYVSPAVRIDMTNSKETDQEIAPYAYHFVDGGYFDNDGTGSVIEFLRAVEANKLFGFPKNKVQPILLVEIRDGGDVLSDRSPESYSCQVGHCTMDSVPRAWGPWRQLAAPAQAMYLAGHESITRRNRRELCLLEDELAPRRNSDGSDGEEGVIIHHVVFPLAVPNDALSWHLTPLQIATLRSKAPAEDPKQAPNVTNPTSDATRSLNEAVNWLLAAQANPTGVPSGPYKTCEVYPQ